METTKVKHCGFNINCRVFAPWLDLNILTKLIADDEYGIDDFAKLEYPVKTILDIGGHIGGFGLKMKKLYPDATLIAIEPHPVNHSLYIKNLIDNDLYKKCKIIKGAIGYNKDKSVLVHSPTTTGGGLMLNEKEANKYIGEDYRFYNSIDDSNVKIYTIEEITDGIDIIDVAKWDCEGAEKECFENISDKCANKFRFMMGEYHLWSRDGLYLKANKIDCYDFWKMTKRKFKHLYFNYNLRALGLFQAWPKGEL